jgi:hypothetical protein
VDDIWSVATTVLYAEREWADVVAEAQAADPTPCPCRRCHRLLTAKESIRAGIGPSCAAREAANWQLPIERNPA